MFIRILRTIRLRVCQYDPEADEVGVSFRSFAPGEVFFAEVHEPTILEINGMGVIELPATAWMPCSHLN